MKPVRKLIAYSVANVALLSATWFVTVVNSRDNTSFAKSESEELSHLERQLNNVQLHAPLFAVVDQQGKPIFEVHATEFLNWAQVFSPQGQDVASMTANADGGYFLVRSEDGSTKARLGIDQAWAGLRISERGTQTVTEKGATHDVIRDLPRIELGGTEGSNYSLKFPGFIGPIAGIGEAKAGNGALVIGDSKGTKRVAMFTGDDGKGLIAIYNEKGTPLGVLGEAPGNASGELVLADANGEPRVKMGTNGNRYGVVMALPQGLPYVPKSGLPGSYMFGCASCPR